jgi:deazaflavin-dependent oxidoreductase (nitroreductase family)
MQQLPAGLQAALRAGLTCDITTYGRKSGQARRLEIWYFVVDGHVYISGTPGTRDWYANLQANPAMILHVKEGATADLPARAALILDPAERRRIMMVITQANSYFHDGDIEDWVTGSPLIRVDLL